MTIVGTRPELIKLSLVIPAMDQAFDHVLVHTGQNFDYELNEVFFKDLGIRKPNHFLNCAAGSAIQTIAQILVRSEEVLTLEKPDAVLIYGDTNSCLAALSAKKLRIPIFHMEAGNRCFDDRVPEEINRRILDHLCDINMPLTEHGRRYLINEGLPPHRIIKTGSCMSEVLMHFKAEIGRSKILTELKCEAKKYFLVSCHREENVDSPERLQNLLVSLDHLAQKYSCKVIFSLHPRTKLRIDALVPAWRPNPNIQILKPQGYFDYIKLQTESFCVLSDSGTLMEEASILGFAAVHCRDSFERPEGMEYGTLIVSPIEASRLSEAVQIATSAPRVTRVPDYEIVGVANTVVRIIQSYTPMINREVWHRAS